jgi:hypothetical protein
VDRVPRDRLRIDRGEELLASYSSSPDVARRFCARCGTHVL